MFLCCIVSSALAFLTASGHAVDQTVPVLLIQSPLLSQCCHLPQLLPWGHVTHHLWPQLESCRGWKLKSKSPTHWNMWLLWLNDILLLWSINSYKIDLDGWRMFKFSHVWLPPLEGSNSPHITELLIVIGRCAAIFPREKNVNVPKTTTSKQTHFVTGLFNDIEKKKIYNSNERIFFLRSHLCVYLKPELWQWNIFTEIRRYWTDWQNILKTRDFFKLLIWALCTHTHRHCQIHSQTFDPNSCLSPPP